jgi:hypothetical protein
LFVVPARFFFLDFVGILLAEFIPTRFKKNLAGDSKNNKLFNN